MRDDGLIFDPAEGNLGKPPAKSRRRQGAAAEGSSSDATRRKPKPVDPTEGLIGLVDGQAQVTAVKPMGADPMTGTIHIDGRAIVRLPMDRLDEAGVRVGAVWDETTARKVGRIVLETRARAEAMKMLTRRNMSTGKLGQKLREKGFEPAAVRQVVARLTEAGLLNDEAVAKNYAQRLTEGKPIGQRLLEVKLIQQRLPRDLVGRVSRQAAEGRDPVADAARLMEREMLKPSVRKLDPVARKRRLWGLLARRGFDGGVIQKALAAARMEEDDAD